VLPERGLIEGDKVEVLRVNDTSHLAFAPA
jgi:hypothetical protein